jgi:hypothetical protein
VIDTRPSTWEQTQREAGFQGGQWVIMTTNLVFEKDKGRSLKTKQLDQLHNRAGIQMDILEAPCGLRVSFCSGLATRVKVRVLLAELLPIHMQRKVPSHPHWQVLTNQYKVIDGLLSGSLGEMTQKMRDTDKNHLVAFLECIEEVLLLLRDTGLNTSNHNFGVAYIPEDPVEPVRRVDFNTTGPNFWTNALRDTDLCATYAYFTLSCLGVDESGCRATETEWHKQILLLQTKVYRHGHTAQGDAQCWDMHHGDVFRFGKSDADMSFSFSAKALRSPSTQDPRLLIRPLETPPRLLKRLMPKKRRLQAFHLQESFSSSDQRCHVFMTSTAESHFNFDSSDSKSLKHVVSDALMPGLS